MSTAMIAVLFSLLAGCQFQPQPRLREGAYFGSPFNMKFPNPEKLGNHHYTINISEKNGMVYSCRGGFIDIGHLREAADRTAYLAGVSYRNIMKGKKEFSFRVIEPSRYWVKLSYPENWENMTQEEKEETAKLVSIRLGQHFAHTSLIWHEIVTWYGFSSLGIFPENISSFSWEDTYSDLLGTSISVEALSGDQKKYDKTMTELIDKKMKELEVQPSKIARQAAKEIAGKWYTGGFYFFVDMIEHNFDVGLSDGHVTPRLVPGICPDAEPLPCPTRSLDFLSNNDFGMQLEIQPRIFEGEEIRRSIGLENSNGRITPKKHFAKIIKEIKKSRSQNAEQTEGK